ncbi:FkbM family methyltransferase [Chryseobacterium defluvii]|uniref:FkbM family methyltransferase n=1 Tax=Chryseobacterium defluvii TaxID=160396 RepID=A0A840KEK8_9FLAO|nr:FkbM family methyltransferase [Chryseobacterium defluvii]MBB4805382.1 FkbM family methyltransferase [Chryseobacterium defluvii]
MSFKNYISKLVFCNGISNSFKTFTALIINSKRYSSRFKKNTLDLNNNETFVYHLKSGKNKFKFYLRTFKGDIDIFYEVFWRKTYDRHLSFLKKEPVIIVDLGAHIGMTSVYLALKYPHSKIYAIEASSENFELLKVNTEAFKNITCIHAAAYFEDGMINFGNNELSYNQMISENGDPVKALSIETLMRTHDLSHIDLIKIDIEGGETELLSRNNSWLKLVDHTIIEIHTPYTPSDLRDDIQPYGFEIKSEKDSVLFAAKK